MNNNFDQLLSDNDVTKCEFEKFVQIVRFYEEHRRPCGFMGRCFFLEPLNGEKIDELNNIVKYATYIFDEKTICYHKIILGSPIPYFLQIKVFYEMEKALPKNDWTCTKEVKDHILNKARHISFEMSYPKKQTSLNPKLLCAAGICTRTKTAEKSFYVEYKKNISYCSFCVNFFCCQECFDTHDNKTCSENEAFKRTPEKFFVYDEKDDCLVVPRYCKRFLESEGHIDSLTQEIQEGYPILIDDMPGRKPFLLVLSKGKGVDEVPYNPRFFKSDFRLQHSWSDNIVNFACEKWMQTGENIYRKAQNDVAAATFVAQYQNKMESYYSRKNQDRSFDSFCKDIDYMFELIQHYFWPTYIGNEITLEFSEYKVDKYEQWSRKILSDFVNSYSRKEIRNSNQFKYRFKNIGDEIIGDIEIKSKWDEIRIESYRLKKDICNCPEVTGEIYVLHSWFSEKCPNKNLDILEEYECLVKYAKILEKKYKKTTIKYKLSENV
tara:strand:+ start:2016 stop:3494 length:1479 start_codon:yes stop_codon:yes gene_type:complete